MTKLPLTGVVPAAAGSGTFPPGAVKFTDTPVFDGVIQNGVGGQSAYFDTRVMTQEVTEGHPAETGQRRPPQSGTTETNTGTFCLLRSDVARSANISYITRTLHLLRWHADSLPARSSTQTICDRTEWISRVCNQITSGIVTQTHGGCILTASTCC